MFNQHTRSNRAYRSFFFTIIIPSLVVALSLILVIAVNFFHNKSQLQNNALSSLNQISALNEEKLSSLIKQAEFLYNEREIAEYVEKNYIGTSEDISAISARLNSLCASSSYVNSIYIIDTDRSAVIMDNNKYNFEYFFENTMKYETYSHSYWKTFEFYTSTNSRILLPTKLSFAGNTSNVIPIVLRAPYESRRKSYIVMNVNISSFTETSAKTPLTKNSHMYILNNYTRNVFSLGSEETSVFDAADSMYMKLMQDKQMFDIKTPQNGSATVVKYSTSNSFIGYTYYALIPISDIFSALRPLLLYSAGITLLFLFLAVFVALRSTDKLISPFRKISDIITPDSELDINNIEQIALQLKTSNVNLMNILPYAQEKYLITFLNSTEYSIDEHTQNIIKQSLPFKHDFFAVVVVQLSPTSSLYNEFTSAQYANIESGFYTIVKDMFLTEFDAFVLSSERETLYIILNAEHQDNEEKIKEIIQTLCKYLENDMEVINFSTGTSRFYHDLLGLKKAHKEALSNLKLAEKPTDKITFNTIEKNDITFILKDSDENEFYSALISTNIDRALEIFKKIDVSNADISVRSRKQLYTQILSVILRAMRIKKIQTDENKTDFEIFNDILSKPVEDVKNEILLILERIKNNAADSESKDFSTTIVRYIEDNYCKPEMSLDFIANTFNTNASYVSSIVSQNSNIGFHEYVTNLRVTKAKHLLAHTDDTVSDIYTECGFSSQQTFYRIFKKHTGMTPNSYRKLTRNN